MVGSMGPDADGDSLADGDLGDIGDDGAIRGSGSLPEQAARTPLPRLVATTSPNAARADRERHT